MLKCSFWNHKLVFVSTYFNQVHAYVISHLHEQMPSMFGKEKAKRKLIDQLDKVYSEVSQKYNIPIGKYKRMSCHNNVV